MTIEILKKQITEQQGVFQREEAELHRLYDSRTKTHQAYKNLEKQVTFQENKIGEIKRAVFSLTVDLEKKTKEKEQKERLEHIERKLKQQPTFDDVVATEIHAIIADIKELSFKFGKEITHEELWSSYQKLAKQKQISRASAIREEYIKRYREMLTSLIEKELDGGTVDLIEKRNLKLPIQNFLSNPIVKADLQI